MSEPWYARLRMSGRRGALGGIGAALWIGAWACTTYSTDEAPEPQPVVQADAASAPNLPDASAPRDGSDETPAFTLTLSSRSLALYRGGSVVLTVTGARTGGHAKDVVLSVADLPFGVTSDAPTLATDQKTATIELVASADAAVATTSVLVRAESAGGAIEAAVALTLDVRAEDDSGVHNALDPTFGAGGELEVALDIQIPLSATVTPAGRIVVGGWDGKTPMVARFMPDGTRDPSFKMGQTALLSASKMPIPTALLATGDKLVIGGSYDCASSCKHAVARLALDGEVDGTFGSLGRADLFTGPNVITAGNVESIVASPTTGHLFVGTHYFGGAPPYTGELAVTHLDANGQQQTSWGTYGRKYFASDYVPSVSMVVEGDDTVFLQHRENVTKLATGGSSTRSNVSPGPIAAYGSNLFAFGGDTKRMQIAVLDPAGVRDPLPKSEDGGALVVEQGVELSVTAGLAATSGLFVGGTASKSSSFQSAAALARFHLDGGVDQSFGDQGILFSPYRAPVVVGSIPRRTESGPLLITTLPGNRLLTVGLRELASGERALVFRRYQL
ncbi:MAG: delta-60 repeat domain-containing protein [Labilithrix sp.]|nr:delta-60 repeat domain-containing protein [Labilithrix sp.]MCW5811051.1 delta-60 repeat domain-containing protein [Labilithrix sp.]